MAPLILSDLEHEIFISYTHVDNKPRLSKSEEPGWIDYFHEQLAHKVEIYRGKPPKIWRDKKLAGNDELRDEIYGAIKEVALLVTVISPTYIRSRWCPKELDEFVEATRHQGITISKNRILKVVKLPVDQGMLPDPVSNEIGYEFFERTGEERFDFEEIDPIRDKNNEVKFVERIDDLAKDICKTLDMSDQPSKGTIYLSRPTADLDAQYLSVKRELMDHGYKVVPEKPLPPSEANLVKDVNDLLDRSELSVHLIGRYDEQQAGDSELANARRIWPHKEYELALEKCRQGKLHNLIWIPDDLKPDTEQQSKFVRSLEEENLPPHAEIATVGFESLKDVVRETLSQLEQRRRAAAESNGKESAAGTAAPSVYAVYHQCDAKSEHLNAILDDLEAAEIETFQPVFDDDPDAIHRHHEANLRSRDGILVFSEKSKTSWLRSQKSEIVKSGQLANSNRKQLLYYFAPPLSVDKETFRPGAAAIIHESEEFKPESMAEFIGKIKARA